MTPTGSVPTWQHLRVGQQTQGARQAKLAEETVSWPGSSVRPGGGDADPDATLLCSRAAGRGGLDFPLRRLTAIQDGRSWRRDTCRPDHDRRSDQPTERCRLRVQQPAARRAGSCLPSPEVPERPATVGDTAATLLCATGWYQGVAFPDVASPSSRLRFDLVCQRLLGPPRGRRQAKGGRAVVAARRRGTDGPFWSARHSVASCDLCILIDQPVGCPKLIVAAVDRRRRQGAGDPRARTPARGAAPPRKGTGIRRRDPGAEAQQRLGLCRWWDDGHGEPLH